MAAAADTAAGGSSILQQTNFLYLTTRTSAGLIFVKCAAILLSFLPQLPTYPKYLPTTTNKQSAKSRRNITRCTPPQTLPPQSDPLHRKWPVCAIAIIALGLYMLASTSAGAHSHSPCGLLCCPPGCRSVSPTWLDGYRTSQTAALTWELWSWRMLCYTPGYRALWRPCPAAVLGCNWLIAYSEARSNGCWRGDGSNLHRQRPPEHPWHGALVCRHCHLHPGVTKSDPHAGLLSSQSTPFPPPQTTIADTWDYKYRSVPDYLYQPPFLQLLTFSTRALIFNRWVPENRPTSALLNPKVSDDKRVTYFLTSSRLLIYILLFIGNIELNPGPNSKFFLSTLLHLWGLYAYHINCHNLGLFNTLVQTQRLLPAANDHINLPKNHLIPISLPSISDLHSDTVTVKACKRTSRPRKIPTTICQLARVRGLKICHLNARSLAPKLDEIKILLQQSKAHVMAISETWLTPNIPDSFLSINNYTLCRKDRTDKTGGGVAIYIHQKYAHSILKFETESESLQILLKLTSQHVITIIVTYKPPNVNAKAYITQLMSIIKSVTTKELIIVGDINMDWQDSSSKLLKAAALKLGLQQLIKDPTRYSKSRNSVLDLILTNQPTKYEISGVIDTAISDHSLIFAIRKNIKSSKNHTPQLLTKIPNSKLPQFNAEISNINWDHELSLDNPDQILSQFHTKTEAIREKFITAVKLHTKQRKLPWVTLELVQLLKQKALLLKIYRLNKTLESKNDFTQIRNKCSVELRKAKMAYFKDQISQAASNPKTLWQTLNYHRRQCKEK